MKKMTVVLALVMGISTVCARAASSTNQPPATGKPSEMVEVSQFESAQLVVQLTGLWRFLPSPASPADYFSILMANGIAPAGGWRANQPVTEYDLARVVLDAEGQGSKVPNPSDPASWINYAISVGINVTSVGQASSPLSPLVFPVAPASYFTPGPGNNTPRILPAGDPSLGPVLQEIRELFIVGPQPLPVTPTAPTTGPSI
jgi:hypothetical protein